MVRNVRLPDSVVKNVSALLLISICFAHAKIELDSNRVREIAASLTPHAEALGPSITNRTVWDKLLADHAFANWLKGAHAQLGQPMPKTSDELYLDFSHTGNRDHWQGIAFARRDRMSVLALAECLENKGAFLPALEEAIRDICSEATWVYPAHDGSLRNFKGEVVEIDLGSSRVGWEMAAINSVLGEKLSRATRTLIQDNLERRIFKPYRDIIEGKTPEFHWMHGANNWNAVCHAGVIGAALAGIDSAEERARFVAAAEICLQKFLGGFGGDGYCSEGMGYWNYGFGHFVMLSETVRQSSRSKVDWMSNSNALLPALFGRRAEIINGIYPSIADCHPASQPDPQTSAYIFERLEGAKRNPAIFVAPGRTLFTTCLFSFLPEKLPPIPNYVAVKESPLRTWFSQGGVLICRSATNGSQFAVSLKGGHNAENHNHNDVGSFIVVAGKSMVLVDPGSEVYTARTFSSRRYESDVLNSFGHDVPVVAGKLQSSGIKAHAEILEAKFSDAQDFWAIDISSAYNVPTLTKLERRFAFSRGNNPSLTVRDDVAFSKADSFETALVTWGKWKQVSPSELLFSEVNGAVRVKIETGGIPFEITSAQLQADVPTAKATRIGIRLQQPVATASVTVSIVPEKL